MKSRAILSWFSVLAGLILVLSSACVGTSKTSEPGSSEKELLAVECEGWREIAGLADNYLDGRLVIRKYSEEEEDFVEVARYWGIRSPELGSGVAGDTAVLLDSYGVLAKYPVYTLRDMLKAFCKDPADTAYLVDTLSSLHY